MRERERVKIRDIKKECETERTVRSETEGQREIITIVQLEVRLFSHN